MIKHVKKIYGSRPQSVGDGFVGKNALSAQHYQDFSPFLMLDHHGPMQVVPSDIPKGVDEHPHRGIETVTLVFEGALQHRDSAGNKGTLRAGDMQWMTAASGIVHEEKHEICFSKKGGVLNFIQLWTNLPSKYKMTPPRYQEIGASKIPQAEIGKNVLIRVFSGELAGLRGVAKTYTPILLAELKISGESEFQLSIPQGYNLGLYVIDNEIEINGEALIKAGHIASFQQEGEIINLYTKGRAHVLLLGGEPIQEPIATYGPFVMNTHAEIMQAIQDYQMGKMGRLA